MGGGERMWLLWLVVGVLMSGWSGVERLGWVGEMGHGEDHQVA